MIDVDIPTPSPPYGERWRGDSGPGIVETVVVLAVVAVFLGALFL